MKQRLRAAIAKIAAIGAVRRRGIGGLVAYGGKIEGKGHVIHNSGPRKGTRTDFVLEGRPVNRG